MIFATKTLALLAVVTLTACGSSEAPTDYESYKAADPYAADARFHAVESSRYSSLYAPL